MGATILIVEDEAVLATDLAESLRDHGYEVSGVVSTGEEAVEKALQLKPHIVLVDIHLKGHLDGIQAAKQIRENLDIPVVYLTAYTDATSLERAKLTEPHGYLVKPVDEKELRITLEMALYKSRAEKQLKESEEFNRRLVEHSPMGIIYLGKCGTIEYANPAANRILSFPTKDSLGPIGSNIFDLPLVNHSTHDQSHFKLLLDGEQLSEVEFTYSADNNIQKTLLISAAPRIAPDSSIDGAIFMFVDITDRKRVEQALKKSEERLQLALEGGGLGLWDWNLQTGYVVLNDRWAEMLEYDRDELDPHIGTWQRLTHPDDFEIATKAEQDLLEGRSSIYEVELRRKTKSGDWRWILSRGRIVERDDEGRPMRAAGTVLDITDRKKAEEELEISERRFRTLVETARDVIWTVDLNLRYSYVSPSITELLGYTVDEIMSINPVETLARESRERVVNAFQEELSKEMHQFRDRYTVRIEEIEQYRKDGTKIWVDLTTTFLRDHEGRPLGILGISHDVSHRKIAEQQLKEAHDKLEERVKERTRELRNTNKRLLEEISERERTAEALRESEERFRAIFETARDCIFIKDRNLKYVQVNPAFERLFKMKATEIVGLPDEELFGQEAGHHIQAMDAKVLAGETVEEDHTKPVGEFLHTFHVIKVPMRDKSGEVVGICGIARDITERKLNEEALRREKENLANVLEAMEDGVYIANDKYAIEYLNKSLEREFGPVEGKCCYEYFHGTTEPCRQCIMPPKLDSKPIRFEWSSPRNSRTYDLVDTTLKNADGTLSKLEILRDITDRKKAEATTKHLAELQQLVAALSTNFINLPPEEIDDGIHEALQEIGQFADVDRSYVFLLSGDDNKVINTHEWCADGIEPLIEKRINMRAEEIPYFSDSIINKMTVHIPSVADLESHAEIEKQTLEALNIKSVILAPMLSKGSVRGLIGIESLKTERAWPAEITGLLNIVADMFSNALDRKRTEQALRDSEKKFRELAELLPAFVTEADTTGKFTFVNKACLDLTGYTWEDYWAGINADQMVKPEDRSRLAKNVANLISGKEYTVNEYEIVRKDGTSFPVVSYSRPLVRDGKIAGIRSVSVDITERKKAEEALRRSEQRFRAIFEGAQDSIFIKDQRLRYTEVNPAMEKIHGMKSLEIIGKTDQKIFDLQASKHLLEIDRRVLNGEVIEEEHTRIVNGASLTFLDVKVPLEDPHGTIVGICGISRNITERKKAIPADPMVAEAYRSKAMLTTLAQARIAAVRGSVILLLGESGSGKDYLARWIHNHSPRASGPYFSLNCAAISKELAESELFGHEAGAFTGARGRKKGLLELAEGGTLLLNEIGELPLALQSKLLTFLDTKSFLRVGGEKQVRVDARLIAATHRELEKEITEGRFLEPLFYRLNVFTITVPPLRERVEDLPILVEELLSKLAQNLQLTEVPMIDSSDIPNLAGYQWPGNVRELRNVLERALLLWEGDRLELPFPRQKQKQDLPYYKLVYKPDQTLKELHEVITRWACIEALRYSDGNKKNAARKLGISRESIHRYIRRLGIKGDEATA